MALCPIRVIRARHDVARPGEGGSSAVQNFGCGGAALGNPRFKEFSISNGALLVVNLDQTDSGAAILPGQDDSEGVGW